jgi:hypothetical protein
MDNSRIGDIWDVRQHQRIQIVAEGADTSHCFVSKQRTSRQNEGLYLWSMSHDALDRFIRYSLSLPEVQHSEIFRGMSQY